TINDQMNLWDDHPLPIPTPDSLSWSQVDGGSDPARSVVGGYIETDDGSRSDIHVCRAYFARSWHPGRVEGGRCLMTWGGNVLSMTRYQVLVGAASWYLPGTKGAVIGGQEWDMETERHLLCRATVDRAHAYPGKLLNDKCLVALESSKGEWNETPIAYPNYS